MEGHMRALCLLDDLLLAEVVVLVCIEVPHMHLAFVCAGSKDSGRVWSPRDVAYTCAHVKAHDAL